MGEIQKGIFTGHIDRATYTISHGQELGMKHEKYESWTAKIVNTESLQQEIPGSIAH